MKKQKLILLSIIGFALFLTGCVSTFNYHPDHSKISQNPITSVVAVINFANEGSPFSSDDVNAVWAAGIPLMPFGWGTFSRPESGSYFFGTSSFNFNPSIDLTKAAEQSLSQSGLFSKVYYADQYTNTKKAKYIFTGIIYSTKYSEKVITYGTSIAAPVLWLAGLPSGVTHNELKIRFLLKDAKTGQIIWSYLIDKEDGSIQWIYLWDRNFQGYSSVMKSAMQEALQNLFQFIGSNGGVF